jgi:hypothetical protein
MEYLGVALLAAVVLGGAWLTARLMSRTGRNDDATHGGGFGGSPPGI